MWRTGRVWRLTGKRLCGSRVTQQRRKKPNHAWAAAPYLQSPKVLFCYRFTLWVSARLTHTRMMYREHMAFGIRPRGFASDGPAMRERRAFEIQPPQKPVTHQPVPDCGRDIHSTNKLSFTPSQHTAINRGRVWIFACADARLQPASGSREISRLPYQASVRCCRPNIYHMHRIS